MRLGHTQRRKPDRSGPQRRSHRDERARAPRGHPDMYGWAAPLGADALARDAGGDVLTLTFTNRSDAVCHMTGFPRLALIDGRGHRLRMTLRHVGSAASVALDPDEAAWALTTSTRCTRRGRGGSGSRRRARWRRSPFGSDLADGRTHHATAGSTSAHSARRSEVKPAEVAATKHAETDAQSFIGAPGAEDVLVRGFRMTLFALAAGSLLLGASGVLRRRCRRCCGFRRLVLACHPASPLVRVDRDSLLRSPDGPSPRPH